MAELKQVEDYIQRLNTTLQDTSINVEDIAEIWNENVKKVQNIPAVKQGGSPAQQRWANFVQEKSNFLKNKGNSELTANHNKEAIAWFNMALAIDPENHVLYSNRSAAYTNLGDFKSALQDANRVIQINPTWSRGYSRKGLAAFWLNQLDDSFQAYKKGLELEPENEALKSGYQQVLNKLQAQEANILGEQHIAKGKPHEAVQSFTRAIELDNTDPLFYSNRSDAWLKYGNVGEATKDAEKVIAMRPTWFKGYQRKADALLRAEKYDEAASMYANVLQLDPNNAKAKTDMNTAMQESFRARYRQQNQSNETTK